ncbi:hypothetical protein D5S18_00330 [Nocardia panacis]|uniref:Uncharacterized protein n=1 Tax=Nocardia panacis TaxID=2340916 RepID=A0A3A4KDJ6_9NOCA|nr:hypothetical protein [Nocardia panacis]RJO80235.1 hypothetical protein D5S18_00330 [Nocardia panacis]
MTSNEIAVRGSDAYLGRILARSVADRIGRGRGGRATAPTLGRPIDSPADVREVFRTHTGHDYVATPVSEWSSAGEVLTARYREEAELLALRLVELAAEVPDPLELYVVWQTIGRRMRELDAELRKSLGEMPAERPSQFRIRGGEAA